MRVEQRNLLPGTQRGARPKPVARHRAVGDVNVVVIAGHAAGRILDIDGGHARAARPNDVIGNGDSGSVRHHNAIAANERVVLANAIPRQDEIVVTGVGTVANQKIIGGNHAIPAVDAMTLVVANDVLGDVRGIFRNDAVARIGINEVADQTAAAVAHQTRAAVGVGGIADGLGSAGATVAVATDPQARAAVVMKLIR